MEGLLYTPLSPHSLIAETFRLHGAESPFPYYLIIKEDPYKVHKVSLVFHYEKYCILSSWVKSSIKSILYD